MKERFKSTKKIVNRIINKKHIKYLLLAFILGYLCMFILKEKCYIRVNEDGSLNLVTVFKGAVVIAIALTTMFVTIIENKLSDKINKIVSYVLFFTAPTICYFSLEVFQRSRYDIQISKIDNFYIFLNIFILFVILMAAYVVTNNTKLSVIILSIVTSGFGVINYYVYSFRGIAIVASDVYSVKTATSVAQDYRLFVDYNIYFIAITTLLIIITACKLRGFKSIPTFKLRMAAFAGYMVFFALFVNVFVVSNQLSNWNINVKLFRPHKAYRTYGSVLTTVRTVGYIMVDKPESYTLEQVKTVADEYKEDENSAKTPNIIVIMDEAFSDLETIREFAISEDYMPFIRSLDENTIKGNVYVSVFGGNTANSEFEFLTGNSMAFLPTNSVPYQLFIKDKFPSIVYNLEAQNYVGNSAIHPYRPTGYNRMNVYPLLGFKEFVAIEGFSQDNLLRDKVTDETDFNKIIEKYEASKSQSDAPFFLFNVTMQNHSGYKVRDPQFIQKIKIEDPNYFDDYTQNYLSLVKYTDEAVEKLVTYFKNSNDPTVIIFFGDHQPGLRQSWYDKMFGKSEEALSNEELMVKYQVPFFAWANYDIPEEKVDKISMNYLSSYLMDKIGLKLTKYQQYLLDVHKDVPVMNSLGYWGSDGKYYEYEDTNSPYYEELSEYRNIQYNNIHDKGNRVDNFFYLQ